jgi:acyl transferase domain-containing protein/enoyl-CoA hydratase/carnithine racemase
MGLSYGAAHQPLQVVHFGAGELLAELELPEHLAGGAGDYVLHPSLLDGALQAATLLLVDRAQLPSQPLLPFTLQSLRLIEPDLAIRHVHARRASGSAELARSACLDIDLCDADGRIAVAIRGFMPRPLTRHARAPLFATREWEAVPLQPDELPQAEPHVMLCGLPHLQTTRIARDCQRVPLPEDDAAQDPAELYARVAEACFDKLQQLLGSRLRAPALLQLALPDTEQGRLLAGLAGMLRSAHLENPLLAGQVLLLDPQLDSERVAALLHAERAHPHEVLVRLGDGYREVTRWRLLDASGEAPASLSLRQGGVYLITGGLGGLGRIFARELAQCGTSPCLILSGRAAAAQVAEDASAQTLLAELAELGARAEYVRMDPCDQAEVDATIASIRARHGELHGILHSAGTTRDGYVLRKTRAELHEVLAPKVQGSVHLDRASADCDLDFLVLFSSLSAALGNLGQSDYAAANGFLDEFAVARNRQVAAGLRRGHTLAIRWPLWREGGMQPDASGIEQLRQQTGIEPMQSATGLRLFHRSLALGLEQCLVMEGDLAQMQRSLGCGALLHTGTPDFAAPRISASATPGEALPAESELQPGAEELLRAQFASLLKLPLARVQASTSLEDYGIDSILALDLTRALERSFGPLPKTLFFEYQNIRELADYLVRLQAPRLAELLSVQHAAASTSPSDTVDSDARSSSGRSISIRALGRSHAPHSSSAEDSRVDPAIAIIGISGRYPQARDLQAFWRNLSEGRDCIVEVPPERWNWRDYYSEDRSQTGRHYSRWGGFIEGVDEFDARFFGIAPIEADLLDPQERLFLEQAWLALEDAGLSRASLQIPHGDELPAQVGVYAGVMYGEYQLLGAEASLGGERMGFASNLSSIANRVSYVLNLHGPSLAVDTMCSSSLTAIHLACQDLKLGHTDLALAGGVNISIHPNKYLMLSAGQFISGDGHCQSFGEGGDGYIPGEGVGVVVLKRLADAERDGDLIHAVIRGSALSHGGRTHGYTVPNPQAQASAVRQALRESGIDARAISYIEAHGTGTKLGDPIEIAGLQKVFREHTEATGFCLIGSAKSNIGHCEAAAGIAGLSKVLLQMRHAQIVPSLHSTRLNPHIDFAASPFVVNQVLQPWQRPLIDGVEQPRIAGISSFGAGGANAHLIVEEYRAPALADLSQSSLSSNEHVLPISARNEQQLRHKVSDLLQYMEQTTPALDALAYSLQVGREAMEQRLCLRAESLDAARSCLSAWLDGGSDSRLQRGQARAGRERLLAQHSESSLQGRVQQALDTASLDTLAELWTHGLEVEWSRLHAYRPQRLRLPTYPFARQRHWAEAADSARRRARLPAQLHPLLHANVSDLDWHRYATRFEGNEAILSETPEGAALGEAAALAMAHAALMRALPPRSSASLALREIAWVQPRPALAGRPVHCTVWANNEAGYCFEISLHADGADEQVLCQGRADWASIAAEVEPLHSQPPRQLDLPPLGPLRGAPLDLHPGLLQHVLQPNVAAWPLRLERLQVLQATTAPTQAQIWACADDSLDIDLLDAAGSPCLQLRGLRHAQHAPATDTSALPVAKTTAALPVANTPAVSVAPRRVAFVRPANVKTLTAVPAELSAPTPAKPRGSVRLNLDPQPVLAAADALPGKPRKALQALQTASFEAAAVPSAADSEVSLFELGAGVYVLQYEAELGVDTPGADTLAADSQQSQSQSQSQPQPQPLSAPALQDLRAALAAAAAQPELRVLVLRSSGSQFLGSQCAASEFDALGALGQELLNFPQPLIALVDGQAIGVGLLLAALCDFLLLQETTHCGLGTDTLPPSAVETLLEARFGLPLAEALLYEGELAATELQARGLGCLILSSSDTAAETQGLPAQVLELAQTLTDKPAAALQLLKQHLAQPQRAAFRELCARLNSLPALTAPVTAAVAEPVAQSTDAAERSVESLQHGLSLQPQGAVLRVELLNTDSSHAGEAQLQALETLLRQPDPQVRCLILEGTQAGFLPTPDPTEQQAWSQRLQQALALAPCAVLALPAGGARGLGWHFALLCDLCLHVDTAEYLFDAAAPADWLAVLPAALGEAWLLPLAGGLPASGAELQARTSARVVSAADAQAQARPFAERLAALAPAELSRWRIHRHQRLQLLQAQAQQLLGGSGSAAGQDSSAGSDVEPTASERRRSFGSGTVEAELLDDGVLDLRLCDRQARNMFTPELSSGLREALAWAEHLTACKLVVLSGYDSYFASGGTPATLFAIHAGSARFTDDALFEQPLICRLPVIAALQGHGLGAGWALGMFADASLLAAESRYRSPYMDYGFTPGAGATAVFPARIGLDLARESLLTAREFDGAALAARGLRQPVLARAEVRPAALALAQRLATLPRERLQALKRWQAASLRQALPALLQCELDMHAQSFVGQAEPLARIQARLGQGGADAASAAAQAAAERHTVSTTLAATKAPSTAQQSTAVPGLQAIAEHLRSLLADELRLPAEDIADNEQFVDLGLDSITGVTWVRRINQHYGTAIEAIRVYSYPTLARLAEHVAELLQAAPLSSVAEAAIAPATPGSTTTTEANAAPPNALDAASVRAHLRSLLADELRLPEPDIDDDEQFVDLGLDSITGVTWVRRINTHYGTAIEAIRVYSYPTLRRLAEHILAEAATARPSSAVEVAPTVQTVADPQPDRQPARAALRSEALLGQPLQTWRNRRLSAAARLDARLPQIAVVGMAGRFAQADDIDQFWNNLAAGRDCIEEIPRQRWDIEACFEAGEARPGKTYSRWMGLLSGYDCFDAGFFNISPREARSMDPQQRVFLEACWHALEHAGHAPSGMAGSRCGVFVGCSAGDYHQLSRREALSGQGFTGAAPSILAARIAYLLDLQGPSVSIDTACSSSLVAIASACDSLALGHSDMALAGGVNVMSGPAMQIMTAQVGMLSPQGRCFSFDARADGIVNGEGVGVLLLKRLAEAERDGDCIHGVIEAWGVNQDGRTNGITAPNPEAQTRLLRQVHARFGIHPASIELVEAHGTGTALGDPIEVAGLSAAFAGVAAGSCALGSVKSNIGHCLTAAGVSGVLKLLLALKHRQLPPSLHFERPNPHLALERSPFQVNTRLQPWLPRSGLRRGAVNSFGFSGTNAHVVIAEHAGQSEAASTGGAAVLLALSARSSERLRASAARLLDWLRANPGQDLQRLAYTLQVGRDAMAERLALVVDSQPTLERTLEAVLTDWTDSGTRTLPQVLRGQVGGSAALRGLIEDPDFGGLLQKWIARGDLRRLADLWTQGLDLPWTALLGGRRPPRRLGLPGYPFLRERHWLQATDTPVPAASLTAHPLLQKNCSDLHGQRYAGRIEQSVFCMRDSRESTQALQLMTASGIEMLAAAVRDALPAARTSPGLQLFDLRWSARLPAGAVRVELAGDGEAVAFELAADQDTHVAEQNAHAGQHAHPVEPALSGWAQVEASAPAQFDLVALRAGLGAAEPAQGLLMQQAQRCGLDLQSLLPCIAELRRGTAGVLLHLQLPTELNTPGLDLQPVLVEAVLHCAAALAATAEPPQALANLRLWRSSTSPSWAWLQQGSDGRFDIDLLDAEGRCCIALRGLDYTVDTAEALTDLGAEVAVQATQAPSMQAESSQVRAERSDSRTIAGIATTTERAEQLSSVQIQQRLALSLAEALYLQANEIDPQRSFTELGLDSIIGVEWVKAINREFGLGVAATLVYDYPNLAALAAHLHAELARKLPPQAPAVPEQAPSSPPTAAPARAPATASASTTTAVDPAAVLRELRHSLAEALFMQADDIDPARSFSELGLDSIIGVEWVRVINRRFELQLAATQIYDYPSLQALAAHIATALKQTSARTLNETVTPAGIEITRSEVEATQPLPVRSLAAAPRALRSKRPLPRGRVDQSIRFRPKFDALHTGLYFHCAEARGDYEAQGEFELRCTLTPESNVCLREHVVFGEHLLPTDAYVELVYAGFRSYFDAPRVCLEQLSLSSPLLGQHGQPRHVRLLFRRAEQDLQFFLRSASGPEFSDERLHAQGFIRVDREAPEPLQPRQAPHFTVLDSLPATAIPTNAGQHYAPLQALHLGERHALGEIHVAAHSFGFLCSPFALYGGLCTAINFGAYAVAARFGASEDQFLPVRVSRLRLLGELQQQNYRCHAELLSVDRDSVELAFELVDASGEVMLRVDSIQLRRVAAATLRQSLQPSAALPVRARRTTDPEPVAVIGLSCRLPMAADVDALWQNLIEGRDCVVEVPEQRWGAHSGWYHPDPRHPHSAYSRWAGLLDGIDEFDALFFGISPVEAELIDPQQRVFLQECWRAIESAGHAPSSLAERNCGVYVGCGGGDYVRVLGEYGQDTAGAAFMGSSNAILAARIAYQLNLKGPALAIDTACSSSLVAVHLACESLRAGECELALAGGINLLTTPIGHILTSQVGMPSQQGRCASFDASADGIVFSEGCGVVVLKPLSAALRDQDEIHGVIVGSGINQDGRTNGITAPSSTAQQRLLRDVYQRFAIDPARIGYIEAHGTATALGDPIEVNALRRVFDEAGAAPGSCALGSIKSAIGHTGFAAGVAGLIKTLLCLQHRQLVPSLHYRQPNPYIEFDGGPFHVNTTHCDWVSAQPRLAAVSSFGFSGTNAHVVLAQSPQPELLAKACEMQVDEVLVPLSARTSEALLAQVEALLQTLQRRPRLDLQRLACTLQTGRDAMPHRLALRVRSLTELAQRLQQWVQGEVRIEGLHRGQLTRADDALSMLASDPGMHALVEQWMRACQYERLAELWVRGFELDFATLYPQGRPRRLRLPGYAFARERCWVSEKPGSRRAPHREGGAHAALHPLLHSNRSDLGQQRYVSRFDGSEFFLAEHRVQGSAVLPAVAYLEMARAALVDALPGHTTSVLELQHVAWAQPLRLGDVPVAVETAVFVEVEGRFGFEIVSFTETETDADVDVDASALSTLHCQGSAALVTARTAVLDVDALRQRLRPADDLPALYSRFAERGLDYGPGFRAVVAQWQGRGEVLLQLDLPSALRAEASAYVLHPSLLDGALQGSIELAADSQLRLPFAVECVRVFAACGPRMYAWLRRSAGSGSTAGEALHKVDIDLCDAQGQVCVQLHGFSSRPLQSAEGFDEAHYRSIIAGLLSHELSADQAMELG